MQLLLEGTAIVTIATSEFVVMVADKLGYTNTPRGIVPAAEPIQKLFSWGNRIFIGSAGKMRLSERPVIGVDPATQKFRSVKIEYKFEDWISNFCAGQRADSGITPLEFAHRVFEAAGDALKGIKIVAESGNWRGDNPGDPIVIYVVAGFTEDFTEFGIYQSEVQLNPEGNGLTYVPPFYHSEKIHLSGQTEHIASCCRCAKRRPGILDRDRPLPSSRPLVHSPCDHTTRSRLADGEAGRTPCVGFYGDRICGTSRSDQSEFSNRQFDHHQAG